MLTKTQLDQRDGKLTSSRIACLMTGEADKIMRLYREMIGEEQPEDLSDVWPVQLGVATEHLNLTWYCRAMGEGGSISRHGEVVVHPKYPWAACTLDAWDDRLQCVVEAKHVGGREPIEVVIDRYQPQMQWQMECTGAKQCALTVIMGANQPIIEYIDRDEAYAAELMKRARQFMKCVQHRVPPVALEPVPPPADTHKDYDMAANNEWGDSAAVWLQTKPDARRCADAEKILKNLVPSDARKCFGSGVQITRNRAGHLSLREIQP